MRFLPVLLTVCAAEMLGQEKPRESLAEHFPTEFLVGAVAHGDHGGNPDYVRRSMKVGLCYNIGILGFCGDPIEMLRPLGKLFWRRQPTLKGHQSGSPRAILPSRPESGAHNHMHPTSQAPRDFAVQELEGALRKSQQLKVSITCPSGMKIEVDGEAGNAAAAIKLAPTVCGTEQLAKKD